MPPKRDNSPVGNTPLENVPVSSNGAIAEPIAPLRSRSATFGMLLIVAAVATVFAWPTRTGEFLEGDDHNLVLEHVFVNHPSLRHAGRLLTMIHGDLYQPLPMLTFQADYALAGADPAGRAPVSPLPFHLTNIGLHVVNAALACLIALRLARCRRVAILTGVLFACHPFALEPVAWITGRMILLATLFSLALILLATHRREDALGAWPIAAMLVWILALLSKVLPSVPVAAAWCDARTHSRFPRRWWITYGLLLALTAAGTLLAIWTTNKVGFIEKTRAEVHTPTPIRVLLASRYYFENYTWPAHLSAWSPPPQDVTWLSPGVGIAVAEWILLIGVAWAARRRLPVITTGLVLFVLLMAPFLAATAARKFLTADRYMYLPMLGLHLAVAGALIAGYDAMAARIGRAVAAPFGAAVALCVVVACIHAGWGESVVWSNIVQQGLRSVQVYPDDMQVYVQLAKAYIAHHEPDTALRVVRESQRRWPDEPQLFTQAGEAYFALGDWSAAVRELARAAEMASDNARPRYYYGLSLDKLGRRSEAQAQYRRVLEINDKYVPAVTALARSLRASGDADGAIQAYDRAIELNPHHRDSLFELAGLMIERREWDRARDLLERILDFHAADERAQMSLGVVLVQMGRSTDALAIYDRLLAANPSATTVRLNRAGLLASAGRVAEAEQEFRRVLAQHPGDRNAAIGLHELYQAQHRYDDLLRLWSTLCDSGAAPADARAWLTWAQAFADRADAARATRDAIPQGAPERPFADWALIWDALRREDSPALARLFDSFPPPESPSIEQREQARVVMPALSDLPHETRNSAAGLYTLARALSFQGDAESSRSVAQSIMTSATAGNEWKQRARAWLNVLDRASREGEASAEPRGDNAAGRRE